MLLASQAQQIYCLCAEGPKKYFIFCPHLKLASNNSSLVFVIKLKSLIYIFHQWDVQSRAPTFQLQSTLHASVGDRKREATSVVSRQLEDCTQMQMLKVFTRGQAGDGEAVATLECVQWRAGRGRTINSRRVHFSSVLTKTDKCSRYPLEFLKRYIHTFGEFFWSLKSVQQTIDLVRLSSHTNAVSNWT